MAYEKNVYAVILAGGSGTRFWPLSRQHHPKQFLSIVGDRTLLGQTLTRIEPKVKGSRIFIVTNKRYLSKVVEETRRFRIPPGHILLEPSPKNTAPAVYWAASKIRKINPQAIMAVLPSDHLILNSRAFLKILGKAAASAEKGGLVTLGIVPTRPETGYGYIKLHKKQKSGSIASVERFVEKPSLRDAKKFLKTKKYLWNSGMFIWRADRILEEFKTHLPQVHGLLKDKTSTGFVYKAWPRLPSISIDYGILEKAEKIVTIPCLDIGWSDLGSWEALVKVVSKDKKGNIHRGHVIPIENENTLVFGGKRVVAAIGLKDLIVVDTADALLICRRDLSQKVKDIVSTLKDKGHHRYL